jgi:hypothetical protein
VEERCRNRQHLCLVKGELLRRELEVSGKVEDRARLSLPHQRAEEVGEAVALLCAQHQFECVVGVALRESVLKKSRRDEVGAALQDELRDLRGERLPRWRARTGRRRGL